MDLLFFHQGRPYGVEFKFNEAPKVTRSMRIALEDLRIEHLWIVYPGIHSYPVEENITVVSLRHLKEINGRLG